MPTEVQQSNSKSAGGALITNSAAKLAVLNGISGCGVRDTLWAESLASGQPELVLFTDQV